MVDSTPLTLIWSFSDIGNPEREIDERFGANEFSDTDHAEVQRHVPSFLDGRLVQPLVLEHGL